MTERPARSRVLRVSFDIALPPPEAFSILLEELAAALDRLGLRFEQGPDGRIVQGDYVVAHTTTWQPGRRIVFSWRAAAWNPQESTDVELTVAPAEEGALVALEHRGWDRLVNEPGELTGWFAGEVLASVMRATAPMAFGDWFTDRYARKPSGSQSRATYADPLYHYPNFRVILSELALTSDDYLLEVGCGGGALLREALESGCRAAAIDHSADMVRLARHTNVAAVAAGRLQVIEGDASILPFGDATFTRAAMTGVLGFLPDPVTAFAEIRRVLRPGGRFVGLGSDPELRDTPGAPEPMASRLRFYDERDLDAMARAAGFAQVRVVRRDLEQFAREAGVPEEHLPLFAAEQGEGARFLVCHA